MFLYAIFLYVRHEYCPFIFPQLAKYFFLTGEIFFVGEWYVGVPVPAPWVSPIGCTHGYVLVTAPRFCLWDFRVPWVSVPFRGFSYRLHPRLCSGHRSAVMVFVYFAVVGCICCGRKIPIFGHIIVMIFRGLWMGCAGIATGCVVWRNERRRRDQITTVGGNPRNTAYVCPMHVTAER